MQTRVNDRMKTITVTIKTRWAWNLLLACRVCGSYANIDGKLLGPGVGGRGAHSTTRHCPRHLSKQHVLREGAHTAQVCAFVVPMSQVVLG